MAATNPPPQPRIAGAEALAQAADLLLSGNIVAVPTETVYGLAARADDPAAVAAIYRAKRRPAFNPLIVHVLDQAAAAPLALFDGRAERLARAFWPGPLTLVLPRRPDAPLAPAVYAGQRTVALRSPAHSMLRALLERTGLALAAPSANPSGGISPTRAEHVAAGLGGEVPLILDGGPCEAGVESTIVALRDGGRWQVLRPGPIAEAAVAAVLGSGAIEARPGGAVEAPGQLASHYAPAKPLRLAAAHVDDDEFLIGFGAIAGDISLSAAGDLAEAAARLYACLHEADSAAKPRIAVAPIPQCGIGIALNDRLRRAAA